MEWVDMAMEAALEEAKAAGAGDEVPVGAVVVRGGEIIARGHNCREGTGDPTAHAEIVALRRAAQARGGWYLHGCWLVCTMEPCPMCMGAALQARLEGVVFGAWDLKAGCAGSLCDFSRMPFPHKLSVVGGVRAEECAQLMRRFFKNKR